MNTSEKNIVSEAQKLSPKEVKIKSFNLLHAFSKTLFSCTTIDDVYGSIVEHLAVGLSLSNCMIYEVDCDSKTLIQKAVFNDFQLQNRAINNNTVLSFKDGHRGKAAQTGKAILVGDNSKSPDYEEYKGFKYSEIEVPIILDGRVFAVISSEEVSKDFYNDKYIKAFEIIGAVAISAIIKIKEKEELKNIQNQLEGVIKEKSTDLDLAIETLTNQFSKLKLEHAKKQSLIQEIHHRVNNNLQIISSLINLYISDQDNGQEKALKEIHARVQTMALIHQNIYKSIEMNMVEVNEYIYDLVNYFKGHFSPLYIVFDIKSETKYLSLDTLVPLGLLINELINILVNKTLPPNKKQFTIKIEITKQEADNERYKIRFTSDGSTSNIKSLNLDTELSINAILSSALIEQLEGSSTITPISTKDYAIDVSFSNL